MLLLLYCSSGWVVEACLRPYNSEFILNVKIRTQNSPNCNSFSWFLNHTSLVDRLIFAHLFRFLHCTLLTVCTIVCEVEIHNSEQWTPPHTRIETKDSAFKPTTAQRPWILASRNRDFHICSLFTSHILINSCLIIPLPQLKHTSTIYASFVFFAKIIPPPPIICLALDLFETWFLRGGEEMKDRRTLCPRREFWKDLL